MSAQNNKSPGNDGLTKEFFVTFWDDIKDTFLNYDNNFETAGSAA